MRYTALFAIALVFMPGAILAQQEPSEPAGAPASASASESREPAPMTSRQIAEMRAQILMARKDYAEAVLAYQKILEQDPKNAAILNWTGMAYQQLGQIPLAEHFYRKALSADKHFSRAINNLGTLEYSKGHYGNAIKYYKKALASGEDLAPVYSNLGYAYCDSKQYPQAVDAFNKALALDPDVFEHKGASGSVLQQRSSLDPAALNFLLAKSYAKAGDAERAARCLKLARDDGYKDILSAQKDPDFARVIKDPRVQEVLRVAPVYATGPETPAKPIPN